jgi:carbonic anhydrase/acetyltransferase-like protein (isoleucine patch superfamily)
VGEESIVAAQSLVRVGFKVPPGTLVAGVPAVVKRPLTAAERESIRTSALRYTERADLYRAKLRAAQFRVVSGGAPPPQSPPRA